MLLSVLELALVNVLVHVVVGSLTGDKVPLKPPDVSVAVDVEELSLAFLQEIHKISLVDVPVGVGDLVLVQVYFRRYSVGIDYSSLVRSSLGVDLPEELNVELVGYLNLDVSHSHCVYNSDEESYAESRD